jgi:hypothetical protein
MRVCGAKTRCDLVSRCMEPEEVGRQLLMIAWRYLRLEAGRTPAIPSLLMLFASLYALVRLMLEVLVIRSRSDAERVLELLALRHEVAILRRHVKRPELLPTDRLLLAALGRRLPAGRLLFTPATVLRWRHTLSRPLTVAEE